MASSADAPRRYFSRSWKMLTSQKGWYKPVLLLALGMFVPIFGLLALLGYAFEWARLTAWNIDAAPKQKDVRVGKCIAVGWRAAVVMFVWNFLWFLVVSVLRVFLGLTVFSVALELVVFVGAVLLGLVIAAACLRSAIYTKIGPGLSFSRVWEMLERDYKGLFSIVGIPLVSAIVCGVVVLLGFLIVFLFCLGDVVELVRIVMYPGAFADDGAYVVQVVGSMLVKCVPALIIFNYLVHVVSVVSVLLQYNAVGLWMRQFDVANWGGPKSELPDSSPSETPIASYEYDEPAADDVAEQKPASPVDGAAAPTAPAEPAPAPATSVESVAAPVASVEPAAATTSAPVVAGQAAVQPEPTQPESTQTEPAQPEPASSQEPIAIEDDSEAVQSIEPTPEPQQDSVLDEDIAAEAAAFAMSQISQGETKPAEPKVETAKSDDEVTESEPETSAVEPVTAASPESSVEAAPSPVRVDDAPVKPEEVEADVVEEDETFGAPVLPGYSSTRVITVEETNEFGDKHRTRTVETISESGERKRTVEVDEDADSSEVITTLIPPREAPEESTANESDDSEPSGEE